MVCVCYVGVHMAPHLWKLEDSLCELVISFYRCIPELSSGHQSWPQGPLLAGPSDQPASDLYIKNSKRFRNVQNVILRSLGSQRTREP